MILNVALLQMNSGGDVAANVARFSALVNEAAGKGAQLIASPENTFLMEEPKAPRVFYTLDEHPGVAAASALARTHGVWLLVGSVAVKIDDSGKTLNRSLLFNPKGEIAAHYDKIHLFDVEVGDGQVYKESAKVLAGDKAVIATVNSGQWAVDNKNNPPLSTVHRPPSTVKLGMTVCYDVRFPQLYRTLAKAGAEILAVPAAFTKVTGAAHWHMLLRARAIENGCFVIAPAQCGTHPGKRETFGHSLIVSPWGEVIADGGEAEGIVMATLDLDEVKKVRAQIPSLLHDRTFDVL